MRMRYIFLEQDDEYLLQIYDREKEFISRSYDNSTSSVFYFKMKMSNSVRVIKDPRIEFNQKLTKYNMDKLYEEIQQRLDHKNNTVY